MKLNLSEARALIKTTRPQLDPGRLALTAFDTSSSRLDPLDRFASVHSGSLPLARVFTGSEALRAFDAYEKVGFVKGLESCRCLLQEIEKQMEKPGESLETVPLPMAVDSPFSVQRIKRWARDCLSGLPS